MEYQECRMGRTFVARLTEGEAIYEEILNLARKEKIEAASVMALGGVRKGGVVTGPEDPSSNRQIRPIVHHFNDAREIVGIGTIFPCEGEPSLHFHAGIGRDRETLVGCPRVEASCFLVLEIVIIEWLGLNATRVLDEESGFYLLQFLGL